jgi:hypothetical protein
VSVASPDPYSAPKPSIDPMPDPGVSMRYMEAIRFPFQGPHAWTNILMLGVAQLVPIVGPIVLLGFVYDTLEALFRQKRTYAPPFDFDRLGDYLMRGIWVFLVQMIVSFVIAVPGTVLIMGGQIGGMVLLEQGEELAPLGIVVMGLGYLAHFGLMMLMGFFMTPLSIRVGLVQDFGKSFDFAWYRSFLGKTWVEMLVVTLLGAFLGTAYAFVGFAFFCIGIYFTMAILIVTSMHLQFQLYLLFLARGGQAVEMKEPNPKAMAAWSK